MNNAVATPTAQVVVQVFELTCPVCQEGFTNQENESYMFTVGINVIPATMRCSSCGTRVAMPRRFVSRQVR